MSFTLATIEEKFADVAEKIVAEAKTIGNVLAKVQLAAPEVEAVTALINPAAATIEKTAFGVLGKVVTVVQQTQNLPTTAVGLTQVAVTFTAAEIADVKAVIAALKAAKV